VTVLHRCSGVPHLGSRGSSFSLPRLSGVPTEVVAVVLTYVLYLIGDALDKPVFKRISAGKGDRFKSIPLPEAREDAQKNFGVRDGIYSASMALTAAAALVSGVEAEMSYMPQWTTPAVTSNAVAAKLRVPRGAFVHDSSGDSSLPGLPSTEQTLTPLY